jgi:hypothetical protein
MGTSKSSSGPGSGIPFDPPWLDDIDLPNVPNPSPDEPKAPPPNIPPLAPKARFGNARRSLGDYVKSGSRESLQRALGHYSKTGMGGAKNVANRMRLSTAVASSLFSSLHSLREGNNQTIGSLIAKLKSEGADAYQLIDVIVENVCPNGGSLDEKSCQGSVSAAMSELLKNNPNADISNLNDDNLWALISTFLGYEAFSRIQLDIGKSFERQDVPFIDRVSRLKDMREYIKSEISSQINILRSESESQSPANMNQILKSSIERTFNVFEVEV